MGASWATGRPGAVQLSGAPANAAAYPRLHLAPPESNWYGKDTDQAVCRLCFPPHPDNRTAYQSLPRPIGSCLSFPPAMPRLTGGSPGSRLVCSPVSLPRPSVQATHIPVACCSLPTWDWRFVLEPRLGLEIHGRRCISGAVVFVTSRGVAWLAWCLVMVSHDFNGV